MVQSVLVKKFRSTRGTPYVYDASTNEILKVDEEFFATVNEASWRAGIAPELHGEGCSDGTHERYCAAVRAAINKGLFRNTADIRMVSPTCDTCYDTRRYQLERLILEITQQCNLRCKYCAFSGTYRYERVHMQKCMTKETAERAIGSFITSLEMRRRSRCRSMGESR